MSNYANFNMYLNAYLKMLPKTISITELQRNAAKTLDELSDNPLFVLKKSKIAGVFLTAEQYQQMAEVYEDYLDGLKLEQVQKTAKNQDFIPFSKKRYVSNTAS